MDFDHLLDGFFGTTDLADLDPEQLAFGVDRLRLQFGLERDGGRRFAGTVKSTWQAPIWR